MGITKRVRRRRTPAKNATIGSKSTAPTGISSSDRASTPGDSAAAPVALASIGVEVWRLGRRLTQDPDTNPRIADSYDRLTRALGDAGIRIDDPVGRLFIDGMNAEIIDIPPGVDLATEELVITDVIRPGVFVDDRIVITSQILLDRTTGDASK